jgi:hypothetical protein
MDGRFAIRRCGAIASRVDRLKPQDVVLALKLVVAGGQPWRQLDLARDLHLRASEVNHGLRRLSASRLYDAAERRVMRANLREFLVHGVRYVFPAQLGEAGTGMPTARCVSGARASASSRPRSSVVGSRPREQRAHVDVATTLGSLERSRRVTSTPRQPIHPRLCILNCGWMRCGTPPENGSGRRLRHRHVRPPPAAAVRLTRRRCYPSRVDGDTSSDAQARYAELLRRLAPHQRLRAAMGLSRATRELAEAGVRARSPLATDAQVRREVVVLLYGEEAARRLFGARELDGR